ncbi:MAG: hypothetical protein M1338_04930, partial [Patescibacteria group bacterium]|nr:hypothetical protein [Patescibacteria group bacterium]
MSKINKIIIFLVILAVIVLAGFLVGNYSMLGAAGVITMAVMAVIFVFVLKQPFLGLLLVVFTLPMERIPTLDIGLFTLKLDQVFARS